MVILLLFISSCKHYNFKPKEVKPFNKVYKERKVSKKTYKDVEKKEKSKDVTFSCSNMRFGMFAKWFSDHSEKGLIFSSKLDGRKISGSWVDASYEEILNTIARRHNMNIVELSNSYFIGKLKQADRVTYMKKVLGYRKKSIKGIVDIMLSQNGKCYVTKDGILVVSDKTQVIKRIDNVITRINDVDKNTWVCQLFLVYYRKNKAIDYGAKIKPSANIAYDLTNLNLKDMKQITKKGLNYKASVDALIKADFNTKFTSLKANPLFLLGNNEKVSYHDGQRVPIPKYQKSQYGVVEITGYEYKNVGLNIQVKIIESTNNKAILKLKLENNMITDYVERAPVITGTSVNTKADIKSGGIYLLSQVKANSNKQGLKKFLFKKEDLQNIKLQIWCKVYKVKGFSQKEINNS